jgi:hypothetical protein
MNYSLIPKPRRTETRKKKKTQTGSEERILQKVCPPQVLHR